MDYAVIFAGGVGRRMHNGALPKQFLELNDKPIIIYTLEQFERNPQIDGIVVVCVSGWEEYLREKIGFFGLKKVKIVLTGEKTAFESQFVGINYVREHLSEDDSDTFVLLHDGVRPLVDQNTINKNIECVHENSSAITVVPAIETIAIRTEDGSIQDLLNRANCMMARAPQSYRLSVLDTVYNEALSDNNLDFIDTATMMNHYRYQLSTVTGGTDNIKVTTPTDYYIFKAIMDAKSNEQIFGG